MGDNHTKEEDARVVIEDNIMQFNKNVIQLSNVSCLKIAPEPKASYPVWGFIAIIVGALICTQSMLLGAVMIVVGAGAIAAVYMANQASGSYLVVSLNSGDSFYFSCENESFLLNAEEEMKKCFNNIIAGSVISFKDCSINSSQIGGTENKYNGR